MITTTVPKDWRDLQDAVARILRECGFVVEVEKTISIARGQVEIDVHAEERVEGRSYTILVECKNWRTPVPQSVIHAFRTVVADAGANLGYIVSAAGFQSGALSAANLTNVLLVDWDSLQCEFEATWVKNHLIPFVTAEFDTLITYVEPLWPREFRDLDERSIRAVSELRERYAPFGILMAAFTRWARMAGTPLPQLPLLSGLPTLESTGIPGAVIEAEGYREFLDAALQFRDTAIAEFAEALGVAAV